MELKLKIISEQHKESGEKTSDFLWYDNFYKKMLKYTCNGLKYKIVPEKYIFANNGDKIELSEAIKQIMDYKDIESEDKALEIIEKYCEVYDTYRAKAFPIYNDEKKEKLRKASELFDEFLNYNETNIVAEEEDGEGLVVRANNREEWEELVYFLDRERVDYRILSWRK